MSMRPGRALKNAVVAGADAAAVDDTKH
jgi:hypothetical protein